MGNDNRRYFIRVDVQQEVLLDFGAQQQACAVSNLSLGGIFVKGGGDQKPGDVCAILLRRSGSAAGISAAGEVVRVCEDGMALRFTSMTVDNFLFLQTMLLHDADGSFALSAEPVSRIAFARDNALMVYRC